MKQFAAFILATVIATVATAQELPLRISGQEMRQPPVLRLHNGDFTDLPYTLTVPQISATRPETQQTGTATTNEAAPAQPVEYRGLAAHPGDYNFSRQFALSGIGAAGSIASWNNGGLFATSSMNTFPGMGNIASGTLTVTQDFGRFNITGAVIGTKYHLDNRLYNNFGVAGRVSYRLSDRFTLNAFGSYRQGNGLYHSMAAMPYVATSNYGATISMDISDKFSMEMGAQRYYDPYSHKWMTVPVLIPQININGSKFGVDVGGLLYQILHSLLRDYTDGDRQYGPAGIRGGGNRHGSGRPLLQKASSLHR